MKNIWQQHWQNIGDSNTFGNDYQSNDPLSQTIKNWLTHHVKNIDVQYPVVDLGCANGNNLALYNSVAQTKNDSSVAIGFDYALEEDINKKQEGYILRHGDIANIPYDADSAAVVTSIYASEYCDSDAYAECYRICQTNGHLLFLLHDEDSVICQKSKNTISFYQNIVLKPSFIESLLAKAANVKDYEHSVISLLKSTMLMCDKSEQFEMQYVIQRLQNTLNLKGEEGIEAVIADVENYIELLRNHEKILQAQIVAAENAKQWHNKLCANAAKVIEDIELTANGYFVGRALHLVK